MIWVSSSGGIRIDFDNKENKLVVGDYFWVVNLFNQGQRIQLEADAYLILRISLMGKIKFHTEEKEDFKMEKGISFKYEDIQRIHQQLYTNTLSEEGI